MLSLVLVLLVGIAGRAEASVINMRPFYSISGLACPLGSGGFGSPSCVSYSGEGYSPISFDQEFPPFGPERAFISVGAGGAINPNGQGSVRTGESIFFVDFGSGGATTRIDFNISEPSEIDMTCSAFARFAIAQANLKDVTTGQSLFGCSTGFDSVTVSGSALLNATDTYELFSETDGFDPGGGANLGFDIPGVTEVNILPEPSAIYLLGIALTSLGLVRKRLEKGKERTYVRIGCRAATN
jgi:hypothetical protein